MEQLLLAPWYIQAFLLFVTGCVLTVVVVGTKIVISEFKS